MFKKAICMSQPWVESVYACCGWWGPVVKEARARYVVNKHLRSLLSTDGVALELLVIGFIRLS